MNKSFIFCTIFIITNVSYAEETSSLHITADPLIPTLSQYGTPASMLDKNELVINKSETTIGETLGLEPGVSSSYFGPGASRPIIRGNAGERVRVLKNSIGTFDASSASEDHQVGANPLAADSIVQRLYILEVPLLEVLLILPIIVFQKKK